MVFPYHEFLRREIPMPQDTIIPQTPSDEHYRVDQDQGDVFTSDDPFDLFRSWLAIAKQTEINDPNAMSLATVDADGAPDVRVVLLKDLTEDGFTFFTNNTSAKGRQIATRPKAALAFHWKSIRRQIRIRGSVHAVSDEAADAYFATRAKGAQIGAWASDQSAPMATPDALTREIEIAEQRFGAGPAPRPPHWSGYCVAPQSIEFWVNRPFRLHDRLLFERDRSNSAGWTTSRLYP